ncbi:MAG: hypothetical protein GYA62_01160 [Bacteroidales bacterium]|nr:hypothetical protein [Bacteroidales bacterium]
MNIIRSPFYILLITLGSWGASGLYEHTYSDHKENGNDIKPCHSLFLLPISYFLILNSNF